MHLNYGTLKCAKSADPAGANGAGVGNGGVPSAGRDLAKAMKLAVSPVNS